jgi:hypothetical protein
MAQKALGRLFNASPAADGVWINVQDAGGVAFLCFLTGGVGDTYTIQEAKDAAGTGAQNLLSVGEYFTNTGNATDAWVKRAPSAAQQAAGTVVTAAAATQNAAFFEVQGTSLSDTYKFVKVTSTGAGTVTALARDLMTQRTPENLPAMGV